MQEGMSRPVSFRARAWLSCHIIVFSGGRSTSFYHDHNITEKTTRCYTCGHAPLSHSHNIMVSVVVAGLIFLSHYDL